MDSWGGHSHHEGRCRRAPPPAWPTSRRGQSSDQTTSTEVDIPVKKYREPERASSSAEQDLRCPYRPDDSDYNESSTPPSTRNAKERDPWQFIAMDFALPKFAASFHTWPAAAYLMLSPYSPLALENKEHFCEQGDKWRHAFEDLLDVQNGKGLRTRPAQPEHRSSADWLHYMLTRRAFEPVNDKRIAEAAATKKPESDCEEEKSVTELDIYERFLGKQFPSSVSKPIDTPKISRFPTEDKPIEITEPTAPNKPSVVSTLTTTERTTLPDGRVYSRLVLKKRFADGREESSETVQTNEASEGLLKALPAMGGDEVTGPSTRQTERQTERPPEKSEKKGWFWS